MRELLRSERRLDAVLPTADPAGTIATRTAGLVGFSASLSWKCAEEVPQAPTLPVLPDNVRCSVVETDDPEVARREILGEILGLSEGDLGSALEAVLRSLTIAASLSDALLETRAARISSPRVAPATTLQVLALDLWNAGFRVRFAPSWTPVPDGGIGLGVGGAEEELRGFLEAHPFWEMA
jgi:hypothetical protein